jgi:hypothetical protein
MPFNGFFKFLPVPWLGTRANTINAGFGSMLVSSELEEDLNTLERKVIN